MVDCRQTNGHDANTQLDVRARCRHPAAFFRPFSIRFDVFMRP